MLGDGVRAGLRGAIMIDGFIESLNRAALLERIERLRERLSFAGFRALTEGQEPDELSDDRLRHVITAIEHGLPRE